MYNLETIGRPKISMLGSEDPASVRMLESFHKSLGRPESILTFGPDHNVAFLIQVEKGQTVKDALTVASEDLRHPDGLSYLTPEQDAEARHHVPKLLAQIR
jgi:hypothetical protein